MIKMKGKNLVAILMAVMMLSTTVCVISANATIDEGLQQPKAIPPRINKGKITVSVLSSKGGAILGATVIVHGVYFRTWVKTTGLNGDAVFDKLPIGVIPIGYSVTASKPGYIANNGKWWNSKLSISSPTDHVTIKLTPIILDGESEGSASTTSSLVNIIEPTTRQLIGHSNLLAQLAPIHN